MRNLIAIGAMGTLIWIVLHYIEVPSVSLCRQKYDLSDTAMIPSSLEEAFRRFPWAVMENDNLTCNTYKTSTLCKVNFKAPPGSWRLAIAGCNVMFYGGITNAVFEGLNCAVAGPPDGTITDVEKQGIATLNSAILRAAVDITLPDVAVKDRAEFAQHVIKMRSGMHGEWAFTVDTLAENLAGLSASRGFEAVVAEHKRRYCEP